MNRTVGGRSRQKRWRSGGGAVEASRRAVFVVFALAGLSFMAFASRLVDVKRTLALTPGQLGATLLALSAGSLIGLPTSGWFTKRFGANSAVRVGLVTSLVGLVGAGLGVTVFEARPVVMAGLFSAGIGIGLWDVAMNLEGAVVERHLGRTIMSRFHAAFSAGTVVGALLGAAATAAHVPVAVHIGVSSAFVFVVGWWATSHFLPNAHGGDVPTEEISRPQSSAWREPRIILIGVITLIAACTEGTANDWMAVAMVDGHHLPNWAGVLGFATFLGFMTIGRVWGTVLLDRFGRVTVLRSLFLLAVVGSLLVVFGGRFLAFAGAAMWGLGASLGFPVGMSAAADDPRRAAARMSVVSTIGYLAFLGGPPLLGFLGDHFGVLRALLIIGALAAVALVLSPVVSPPAVDRACAPPYQPDTP